MTKRIKIPSLIDPAKDRLVALDGIALATEWERAAIVWAFTYDGKTKAGRVRKQEAENRSTAIYTVTEFIRLGIKGLVSDHTVKHYRDNWQKAIDAGEAVDILPGDAVVLPTLDWPIDSANQGSRVSADPTTAVQQVIDKHGAAAIAPIVAQAAPEEVAEALPSKTVTRTFRKRRRALVEQQIDDGAEDMTPEEVAETDGQLDALRQGVKQVRSTAAATQQQFGPSPAEQYLEDAAHALAAYTMYVKKHGVRDSADDDAQDQGLEAVTHALDLAKMAKSGATANFSQDDFDFLEQYGIVS